ncbi:hypothetical protein [Methylobacterium fujisawaense]|uniref:hypothetical protein n=1 Tax=Methylobacterium fujisawaense TaxID=107400 RepID=UPI00378B9415
MDLVDAGSPEVLVKRILQAEPNLPVPVPIQELCARLGILRIEDLDTDEFEGGLVTDAKRSEGAGGHEWREVTTTFGRSSTRPRQRKRSSAVSPTPRTPSCT